ncbi:armadillo-type protein [Mycena polygramma]|nr:armadillo-type protein [Mycena polygramma]
MRLMYHEQVRSFIKKTRGVPLSTETLEICFSYLAFKYVSPATKTLILKEMHIRLQLHEHAGLISNSFVLHRGIVGQLLHSSNPRVREHISAVLKALAVSSSASWSLDVWMSLASDVDIEVREAARYAVDQITEGLAGKQAAANPEAWEDCYALLGNTDSRTRRFACDVLGNLAAHESPPSTFLGLQPCLRFVSFLRDDDFEVQRCAVYALARLSNWSRGAEAVVVAGTLEHVPRLLKSYDNETRRWTCEMLGDIAFHASSPIIQLGVDICAGIVSRLWQRRKQTRQKERPSCPLENQSLVSRRVCYCRYYGPGACSKPS